jgi:hypothetical protein
MTSRAELGDIHDLLLERVAGAVDDIRETARGYRGSCPHCGKDDRFVIEERDDGDGYFIKCHAGCSQSDVLDVLELTWRDLRLSKRGKTYVIDLRNPDPATARQVRFAWRGRYPIGKTSLVVGNEGVGKGVTNAWTISGWTRGLLPGDFYGRPINVLVVGDEDALDDTWTPRLIAAEADLDHVFFQAESDADIDFTDPADVEHLRALVRSYEIEVVVFDALLDHLGDAGTDEYKPKAVRNALKPLRRLAADEEIAVIGALHPRKGRVLTFRDLVANSHQFNAVSRSSLLLAPHPDDPELRLLAWGKGNHAGLVPTLEFRIEVHDFEINGKPFREVRAVDWEESEITIEGAVNASTGAPGRPRHEDKRDAVLSALTDEPQSQRAIAKAAGVARSTAQDILYELEGEGALKKTDGWVAENSQGVAEDSQYSSAGHPEDPQGFGSRKPNTQAEGGRPADENPQLPATPADNGEVDQIDDREALLDDLEELGL